ncbi:MAG: hypothetical protein IAE81_08025 [Caldilineaceae bacterium]|nr:hypothetical protein [Caldilineaceae bacterium]
MLAAARFKANYPVSLADAMIAAYATKVGAILLHKDPEYEALADVVRLEKLPDKVAKMSDHAQSPDS